MRKVFAVLILTLMLTGCSSMGRMFKREAERQISESVQVAIDDAVKTKIGEYVLKYLPWALSGLLGSGAFTFFLKHWGLKRKNGKAKCE